MRLIRDLTGRAKQAVPMTLSSGLDSKLVYHPPSTLQLPGRQDEVGVAETNLSPQGSMSSSSSQSSIGSSHGIQKELTAEDSGQQVPSPPDAYLCRQCNNRFDHFRTRAMTCSTLPTRIRWCRASVRIPCQWRGHRSTAPPTSRTKSMIGNRYLYQHSSIELPQTQSSFDDSSNSLFGKKNEIVASIT